MALLLLKDLRGYVTAQLESVWQRRQGGSPAAGFGLLTQRRARRKLTIMKAKNIIIGAATMAVAAVTAYAATVATKTYRTTAYFVGIQQGTNDSNGHAQFQNASFAGHNLANLAMGRPAGATNAPYQVLAMTFACDLSSASLVVYDEKLSNVVATIGQSTSIDSVVQQDNLAKAPNRAHFVTVLPLNANGNDTN